MLMKTASKLGLTSEAELAREEERLSKTRARELFWIPYSAACRTDG